MDLISDAQVQQFNDRGYFITDKQFRPDELAALTAEFDRLQEQFIREAEASGDALAVEIARNRPFVGQVHQRSEIAKRWVRAPIYTEACAKLLGPDADLFFNQAVCKPPEVGRSFAWHQDGGYRETRPLWGLTCWTAVSRATLENGCVWIIPGSHKQGLIEHKWNEATREFIAQNVDETDAMPVELEAGQVVVFNTLLLHKSGANTSDEVRRAYVPQYHVEGVIAADDGEPCGDRFAVVRGGQPVAAD